MQTLLMRTATWSVTGSLLVCLLGACEATPVAPENGDGSVIVDARAGEDASSGPDAGGRGDSSAGVDSGSTTDSSAGVDASDGSTPPDAAPDAALDAGADAALDAGADAALDAGADASDGGTACSPGRRYTVVTAVVGDCTARNGTGRVLDNTTGLTWMRKTDQLPGRNQAQAAAFCVAQGMRLATKDEALAISGAGYAACAFPCPWSTWTSTLSGATDAWVVLSSGGSGPSQAALNFGPTLCVQ